MVILLHREWFGNEAAPKVQSCLVGFTEQLYQAFKWQRDKLCRQQAEQSKLKGCTSPPIQPSGFGKEVRLGRKALTNAFLGVPWGSMGRNVRRKAETESALQITIPGWTGRNVEGT